ncbi:MAG TPA: hypothetical protein VIG72_04755 [Pontibacter sp.]
MLRTAIILLALSLLSFNSPVVPSVASAAPVTTEADDNMMFEKKQQAFS